MLSKSNNLGSNHKEKKYYLKHLLILFTIVILHMLLLRGILTSAPSIVRGEKLIAREELIPFFNLDTQYLNQLSGSDDVSLTFSDEVRVSYSFGISWVRYYKILPFALIVLNSVSCYLFLLAVYIIAKKYTEDNNQALILSSISIIPIYFVLLYSKITHFYSLIIGFSLFALAISLLIDQLFIRKRISYFYVILISGLVLINPAVHFHVMYYLVLILLLFLRLVSLILLKEIKIRDFITKDIFIAFLIVLLSLIPYVIYLNQTAFNSSSNISNQIPVNYWMIYYASIPLISLLSLDSTSHIDLFRHGVYLISRPRIASALIIIVALIPLGTFGIRPKLNNKKYVYIIFIILLIFSIWMSLGYGNSGILTFHNILSDVVIKLSTYSNVFTNSFLTLVNATIQVLRFPHRFQFLEYYALACALAISLVYIQSFVGKYTENNKLIYFVFIIFAAMPIVIATDYREVALSGNFAKFLDPYPVSNDLKEIKGYLSQKQDNKLFILPSLEIGRDISTNNNRYSFIDKLLIYYLNTPTHYYGAGGSTSNKISSFMVYRSIAYEQDWWEQIMSNNIDATHILVPKKLKLRPNTESLITDLDKKIHNSLINSKLYRPVIQGDDFDLYERVQSLGYQETVYLDLNWDHLIKVLSEKKFENNKIAFNLDIANILKNKKDIQVYTDSIERTFYNIYLNSGDNLYKPDIKSVPYSSTIVDSTLYTNNFMSMFTLLTKDNSYNYFEKNLPGYINLNTPYFVGITSNSRSIKNVISIKKSNEYRLLLKGALDKNELTLSVDGKPVKLKRIVTKSEYDYSEFVYFVNDIELKEGVHTIETYFETEPLVIESIGLIPLNEIPNFTQDIIHIANPDLDLIKLSKENYEIDFK